MNSEHPARPAELAEAARMLRALVGALPPSAAAERATARRIEGAAVALDAAARSDTAEREQIRPS